MQLDPHRTAGAVLCAISGAIVIFLFAVALGYGEGSCPADLGATPAKDLNGRTVCVILAR